jgi:hypothetical protein
VDAETQGHAHGQQDRADHDDGDNTLFDFHFLRRHLKVLLGINPAF